MVPLFLALVDRGAIAVPLASVPDGALEQMLTIAQADMFIADDGGDIARRAPIEPRHALLRGLGEAGTPGLILFSSGSSGAPKAIVHDMARLLARYDGKPRPARRIMCFLLPDHIGGVNTLFHGLAHGGTVVTVDDRAPDAVCRTIERCRVQILPTTPTFLNLLLLSGAMERHDVSSLELVTYGTELMPKTTLDRLRSALPKVDLLQTYGLSEVGILQSRSRPDGSLWVRVGGEGYETKIVDGTLWIRARSAMLGYLNAPDKFDAEGWFNTEDTVEQDGEWLRFLGRRSEIINVGGAKAYPAEVEAALLALSGVEDALVRGERNALLGQCVVATVVLSTGETAAAFKQRMRKELAAKLPPYMVPVRVEVAQGPLHSERMKKLRKAEAP
jgi:acyl-coenzyme A synthetase/AMP-(fatty) acid ligase